MTMLTVDDLARDLKVKNEDLLRELSIMGFQVDGPESPLETDDPAELRARLVTVLPQREVVEQRIKPTVIRRRMKKAPEQEPVLEAVAEQVEEEEARETARKKPPVSDEISAAESEEPTAKEAGKKPARKVRKAEPARIIEVAPKPAEPPAVEAREVGEAPSTAETAELSSEPEGLAPEPGTQQAAEAEPGSAGVGTEQAVEGAAEDAESGEEGTLEERLAKKKKRKEKRIQPAQIIGRVDLKREPPARVIEHPEPPRPSHAAPPARPAPRFPEPPRPSAPLVTVDFTTDEEKRKKKEKEKEKKGRESVDARVVEEDKNRVRRRKEVILRDELYDDRRGGRLRARGKRPKPRKTEITTPKAIKRRLKLPENVTVSTLAHKMSVKAAAVIRSLIALGVPATMNEAVDFETATIIAGDFGFETEPAVQTDTDLLPLHIADTVANVVARPPVITVMGHVDHGKTSLLDAIRSTHVTDQEAGGITQHIGAYRVKIERGELVFIDTPGHEAFTQMRARGANVTDFVVLVVAADDGVMEQTKEAINHAKAAKVPIIVAVNKMDKPDADKDRVIRELSEHNLIPESWGGDTLFSFVSAKTGTGIDELLDLILLQAEMMELKANPDKAGSATVIEARLDKGKGPVATVLVKEGTLKLGDPFVVGTEYGKVRAMIDQDGRNVESAGPAIPVEVQGFAAVPDAGDPLIVVEDDRVARQISQYRQEKKLRTQTEAATGPLSLEDLLARMQEQEVKELNLVIKADVQGTAEALKEALVGGSTETVKVKVIHSGVGAINESDVMLAGASRAGIIGFNVRPTPKTSQLAEQEKIDIRLYTVIYEALEDVRKAMEGMLSPIEKETVVGRAEVRQTFSVPKIGAIAGCYVISGKIERSNQVRLLRDNVVIYSGRISSMKRFKDDIKEAQEGYECGIGLDNYKDVKISDIIEAFTVEQEAAKL